MAQGDCSKQPPHHRVGSRSTAPPHRAPRPTPGRRVRTSPLVAAFDPGGRSPAATASLRFVARRRHGRVHGRGTSNWSRSRSGAAPATAADRARAALERLRHAGPARAAVSHRHRPPARPRELRPSRPGRPPVAFIVMELLPGRTSRPARVPRRPARRLDGARAGAADDPRHATRPPQASSRRDFKSANDVVPGPPGAAAGGDHRLRAGRRGRGGGRRAAPQARVGTRVHGARRKRVGQPRPQRAATSCAFGVVLFEIVTGGCRSKAPTAPRLPRCAAPPAGAFARSIDPGSTRTSTSDPALPRRDPGAPLPSAGAAVADLGSAPRARGRCR